MDWVWVLLLLFPLSWWLLNKQYRLIWGRKLKTRWAWASHGALLFSMRLKDWEADVDAPWCEPCGGFMRYLGRKPAYNWFVCGWCGAVTRVRYR